MQGDPALQNSFEVTSDGAAGDLIAKLVSETGWERPGVEVLGKDEMVMENGGAHPWSLKDGTDSTLLLFNHSGDSKSIRVLLSAGSVLWQKEYTLNSMETLQISIGDLIQNKVPDDSGKAIPAASTSGIAEWFSFSGGTKGRILQSNATTGMARNFSCGEYADVAGATWQTGSSNVPVGSTGDDVGAALAILDLVYPGGCTGSYAYTGTAFNYDYTSSAPSIAAIAYPTDSYADVNADGGGSATIMCTITDPQHGCSASASGSVTVQVPTSLKVLSANVLPTGSSGDYGCLPSQDYGIDVDIKYQVMDGSNGSGSAIQSSSMLPQENGIDFYGEPFNSNIGPSRISTTSEYTASDGTFHDAPFGFCQNLPFTTGQTFTATQNITIVLNNKSYPVRSQGWTVSDTAGAAGFDHGSIKNKVTSGGTGSDVNVSR